MSHTKAVCRQSYIHPGLIGAFENGALTKMLQDYERASEPPLPELTRDEALFLSILPALGNQSR
jgi:DNA topoisomerase IB